MSQCPLTGKLVFGDGTLPLDNQKMAKAGYCGIRKSMMIGSQSLSIQEYDILRLLIRGDGNIYNLNVSLGYRSGNASISISYIGIIL